jgi:hypothetical protein
MESATFNSNNQTDTSGCRSEESRISFLKSPWSEAVGEREG